MLKCLYWMHSVSVISIESQGRELNRKIQIVDKYIKQAWPHGTPVANPRKLR